MVKISLHIRENLQNPQKVKCWTPNEYQGCLWNVKPSSSLQWHLHPNRHFIFIQETNGIPKALPRITRFCQAVVHDGQSPHPRRETVLSRVDAHIPRVPVGRLGQLLLQDGQGDLAGRRELPHGDHLPREPPALGVTVVLPVSVPGHVVAAQAGPRRDGVATAEAGTGFMALWATSAFEFFQHPVQNLFDYDRDDIKKGVYATYSH